MNTPVSFPLAKLLKEKGFDKRVKGFYDIEKELHINYVDEMNTKGFANRHLPKGECSAPTISDIVIWLYEKYGIWIFADYGKKTKSWYYNIQTLATSNHTERILWESGYNSPTEAYEAAITYVLTKLI